MRCFLQMDHCHLLVTPLAPAFKQTVSPTHYQDPMALDGDLYSPIVLHPVSSPVAAADDLLRPLQKSLRSLQILPKISKTDTDSLNQLQSVSRERVRGPYFKDQVLVVNQREKMMNLYGRPSVGAPHRLEHVSQSRGAHRGTPVQVFYSSKLS